MNNLEVLIVEDNIKISRTHQAFVDKVDGFTVTGIATSIAEAKLLTETLEPDLILLDIYFSESNGIEFLKELRASHQQIDVILITRITSYNVCYTKLLRKLYLQPNQYYNSKPDYPVSGIKLKLVDGKVLVANIVKSSTAFLSGLRENDEILSINGIKSTDLSTYRQILSKENTKVSISFQTQDTAPKTIRIKLKRLL